MTDKQMESGAGEVRPLEEIKAELARRGYTHVESFGGAIPLESWDPYGMSGVNARACSGRVYHGAIEESGGSCVVVDAPRNSPIVPNSRVTLGRWPIGRDVGAARLSSVVASAAPALSLLREMRERGL